MPSETTQSIEITGPTLALAQKLMFWAVGTAPGLGFQLRITGQSGGEWLDDSLNPSAGVQELGWLLQNRAALNNFRNLWIGVLGRQIVASGTSFDEVYQDVSRRGLADVLIEYVPAEPSKWDHLIA